MRIAGVSAGLATIALTCACAAADPSEPQPTTRPATHRAYVRNSIYEQLKVGDVLRYCAAVRPKDFEWLRRLPKGTQDEFIEELNEFKLVITDRVSDQHKDQFEDKEPATVVLVGEPAESGRTESLTINVNGLIAVVNKDANQVQRKTTWINMIWKLKKGRGIPIVPFVATGTGVGFDFSISIPARPEGMIE